MNKNLLFIYSLFFCVFISAEATAQVKVYATLSPNQIRKNEYVTYRFIVENGNAIKNIQLPAFKDFIVVSGPSEENGASMVNGKTTSYAALSFILQPKKTGKISLAEAAVSVQGKIYKTAPVSVQVLDSKGKPQPQAAMPQILQSPFAGRDPFSAPEVPKSNFKDYILEPNEDIAEKVQRNMQLKLEVSKTSCYVGESILATYVLYSRLRSETRMTKNPAFNGFSVIDLPVQEQSIGVGVIDGREFNKYEIRKAQLYPLMAGNIEFDQATLENNIKFIKAEAVNQNSGSIDWFDGLFMQPNAVVMQTINLSSKPLNITVKPLPEAGKPASFKGAVGNFKVDAMLQKDNFSTNEMGELTVTISGDGNLQLVTAPEVKWIKNIEGFDAELTDNVNEQTVPVSGSKSFTFKFNVLQPGEYTLPGIAFSYFDPVAAIYKTANTQSITFSVTQGTGVVAPAKEEIIASNEDAGFNRLFSNTSFWISLAGLAFISILFFTYKARNKKLTKVPAVAKETPAAEMDTALELKLAASALAQQNPLQETEACLYREDCKEFYELLKKEMKTYISLRLQIPESQLNAKTVCDKMDEVNVPNGTCVALEELMQKVEWYLYTPFQPNDDRAAMYSKAQEVIQETNAHFLANS